MSVLMQRSNKQIYVPEERVREYSAIGYIEINMKTGRPKIKAAPKTPEMLNLEKRAGDLSKRAVLAEKAAVEESKKSMGLTQKVEELVESNNELSKQVRAMEAAAKESEKVNADLEKKIKALEKITTGDTGK